MDNVKLTDQEHEAVYIDIDKIVPNRFQPRLIFNDVKIDELSISIEQYGVLSPVILRKLSDEKYEVLAGERRVRASEKAGLKKIPAIISDYNDAQMMELSIIENIQRVDLNPIEEAKAFETLAKLRNLSHFEIATKIGKSRSYVTNVMRLLNLPKVVQEYVINGTLTTGQVKPLITFDEEEAIDLANKIIQNGWSARQVESICNLKKLSGKKNTKPVKPIYKDAASKFRRKLKAKIKVSKGVIRVYFEDDEQLKLILDKLG